MEIIKMYYNIDILDLTVIYISYYILSWFIKYYSN